MPYDALRKGRVSEPGRAYFITTVLARREARYCGDFRCARRVKHEMRRLHEDGTVQSHAWVVMPDHVHWLFQLQDKLTLPETVKTFKARSAHAVDADLKQRGPLWQKVYYDHALRDEEDLPSVARYIVANPLRAGLVKTIGAPPHWDAIWL